MKAEMFDNGVIVVRGLEDDMGEPRVMDIVSSQDGDVTFVIKEKGSGRIINQIQINNGLGGTLNPGVARAFVKALKSIATGEEPEEFLIR